MPRTFTAFLQFLAHCRQATRQLYLLGDIFEYWAGDDDMSSPLAEQVSTALRGVAQCGVEIFWMAGNRDFLVGETFAAACGMKRLQDPQIIDTAGRRMLLTHGDQLCTDDFAYQQFRAMVRDPAWQTAFLARPLAERKQIISHMRQQSRLHQQQQPTMIMDVNVEMVAAWFARHQVQYIIHGHTHRPALHTVNATNRYVLSDWDLDHAPLRGDWLSLEADGSINRHQVSTLADASINHH